MLRSSAHTSVKANSRGNPAGKAFLAGLVLATLVGPLSAQEQPPVTTATPEVTNTLQPLPALAPPPQATAVAAAPAVPVTFNKQVTDVLKMLDAGVAPDVVKAYVQSSPVPYHLSASDVIALKDHGVPAELVMVMLQQGADLANRAAQAPMVAPQPGPIVPQAEPPYGAYGNPATDAYPLTYTEPYVYSSYPAYNSWWYDYGYPYYPYYSFSYWPWFYGGYYHHGYYDHGYHGHYAHNYGYGHYGHNYGGYAHYGYANRASGYHGPVAYHPGGFGGGAPHAVGHAGGGYSGGFHGGASGGFHGGGGGGMHGGGHR